MGGWSTASLVEDGRLTTPSDHGWQVRVLSPAGMEEIVATVVSTGLFARSRHIPIELRPGAEPGEPCTPGLGGFTTETIELMTGQEPVRDSWERTVGPAECYVPSDERDRLETLLERLVAAGDWLPASAWTDPVERPLEPAAFRLLVVFQPTTDGLRGLPDLQAVHWPLLAPVRDIGNLLPVHPAWPDRTQRCGVISRDEATQLREAFTDVGAGMIDSYLAGYATAFVVTDDERDGVGAVVLEALRPEDRDCDDGSNALQLLNCWQVGADFPFGCAVS